MLPTLSIDDVKIEFEKILAQAKSEKVRSKLIKLHKLMESLNNKKVMPSISILVTLANQNGISISTQTFYNARIEGNVYRLLYDTWAAHWRLPVSKFNTVLHPTEQSDILEHQDLYKITDNVLKYKITIMLAELKGARQQLNILKNSVTMAPPVPYSLDEPVNSNLNAGIVLDEYEIEAISKFVNRDTDIKFNELGALMATNSIKRGEIISKPGLKQALLKILNNH